MLEPLSKFGSDDLMGLIAIVGGILISLVAIVATMWLKARKSDNVTRLKQDLVDRGMSANEIEQIVNAGWKNPSR